MVHAAFLNLRQRGRPVDVRLTHTRSIEVGTVQNHQSFHGVSFASRELSKCFAGDEQRHGARGVTRMPRGAIEWRNEGEVSSVDVRCGGLSGRTNRGSIATGPPMQMPVPSISKSHIQGLNLPDLTDSVEFLRGGFWRRAVALFIDLVAVVAVLQVAALALFPLSNGHVQFSAGLLYALNCEYLESVPKGLSISVEFDDNSIADCQQSILGLPTSRALSVSRITRDSAVTKVAQIRHMLDAEGKPAKRFAARHPDPAVADRLALRARPYRGKYWPQDLLHPAVEPIGRAIPATGCSDDPALRGAGAAVGAGLDLVVLCRVISGPGTGCPPVVLAVLGRDRHSLADCST